MIEELSQQNFTKKGTFKDFDNIEFYFEKFITRPLKNFVMGSRDFNVETEKMVMMKTIHLIFLIWNRR